VAELESQVRALQAQKTALGHENIQWRPQAHDWQTQHTRARAREKEQALVVAALRAKIGELTQRLFARQSERSYSSQAWAARQREKQRRGQRPKSGGQGRRRHPDWPVENVLIDLPAGQAVCPHCRRP
jgi:hypothetical protein